MTVVCKYNKFCTVGNSIPAAVISFYEPYPPGVGATNAILG